ncbi:MAG TPA: DNA translocase FtsK 4TM domain-containing protein [Bryobacteraceae bacterium]|nr:DNA translocase FtsK 4TM domain-containing protein [Bryobacteraceae bacterium]
MRLLGPTKYPRLNEGTAVVFLLFGLIFLLSLVSYHPHDLSYNTAAPVDAKPLNLIGRFGAHTSDFTLQVFGLGALSLPMLLLLLAWKWLRSEAIEAGLVKIIGATLLVLGICTTCALGPEWKPFAGAIPAGGLVGMLLADMLTAQLNLTGAVLTTIASLLISLFLISKFSFGLLAQWLSGPAAVLNRQYAKYSAWAERRRHRKLTKKQAAAEAVREAPDAVPQEYAPPAEEITRPTRRRRTEPAETPAPEPAYTSNSNVDQEELPPPFDPDEIPIRTLADYQAHNPSPRPAPVQQPEPVPTSAAPDLKPRKTRSQFRQPSTELLHEPAARASFDSQELKDIAARIKAKLEEFNVLGSVVQINPGPVVTTFEFKPEAGVKYSRITALTEDLCLGLQAESVLIERIPGKPTVGIEVPNTKREVISLREILESEEFRNSQSPLTISLGKDVNGRIKVAALETMPHLLIAGSTGSGKSVMLNTLIMSLLYKSSPHDVRIIMVDPKRVELGMYEGIPHLLTPVITEARKATNALKNAVLEMERRLKLLALQGVRNIDQYNRKVRQMQSVPRSLFEDGVTEPEEELEPLPYIVIIIDELADLMMLERNNVEEAVTRLAQMARAVGMHLVLATQRPSVDVITGLIKANFPARISFRVATRVDSRTILDVMGAEHLLGKGDMLQLPPGSARLTRVHGAYVSESEIVDVVEFWKKQATPEYDKSFLVAPPSDDEAEADSELEEFDGAQDPMYQDAVRVVLEMGKASTSTLQRRLRLGYGRAARILDMMQRDGIIGPPDGSKPREVLKRPDWLAEVEQQVR